LKGLQKLQRLAVAIDAAKAKGGVLGTLRAAALQAQVALTFVGLYLIPTKRNALPEQARMSPAW
jgi:magnesium-protoporphyrin IX monomethyl ester (oxidative) cyclase